jgi:hypothetical protein
MNIHWDETWDEGVSEGQIKNHAFEAEYGPYSVAVYGRDDRWRFTIDKYNRRGGKRRKVEHRGPFSSAALGRKAAEAWLSKHNKGIGDYVPVTEADVLETMYEVRRLLA